MTINKKYGYIVIGKIHKTHGAFIERFFIYPKYRGKGFARKLAAFLPEKCYLLPQPLVKSGKILDLKSLIKFYESLGFTSFKDEHSNLMMAR